MRPDHDLVLDMLVAAKDAVAFLGDCSYADFQNDRMRHRLVHDYFGIDLEQVWRTVKDDLPELITILDAWVDSKENI